MTIKGVVKHIDLRLNVTHSEWIHEIEHKLLLSDGSMNSKAMMLLNDFIEMAEAIEEWHRLGISKINLDLIYGLPGQTVEINC